MGIGPTLGHIEADILWIAAIQDNTAQFFRDWASRMAVMERASLTAMADISVGIDDVGTTLRGMSAQMAAAGTTSATSMGVVVGAVSQVTKTLIRMGKEAVQAFASMIKESANLAAHAESLSAILAVVGQNAGYSQKELDRWEKQMNKNGITIRTSRRILAEMVQQELDLTKAVELSRVAQDVGRISMINSSEAAQRLVHGIATLNPLVLRHLGLTVDFEQAYRNAANQMGRNWEKFTIAEKQQIALNEALRVGSRIAGAYEASMETVGGQLLSMARLVEDLQVVFGQLFQPAYSVIVMELSRALEDARAWLEENADAADEFGQRLKGVVDTALLFADTLVGLAEIIPGAISAISGTIVDLGEIVATALAPIFDISEEELDRRIDRLGQTSREFFALLAGSLATGLTMVAEGVKLLINVAVVGIQTVAYQFSALWGGQTAEWAAAIETQVADILLTIQGLPDEIDAVMTKVTEATGRATGAIPVDEIKAAGDQIVDTMGKIAKETQEAINMISMLNREFAEAFAERAVEIARQEFDEQVRLFRRLEDMQRKHMQRLEDIRRNHARKRADLLEDQAEDEQEAAEDAADRRADLEEEYAEEQAEIWREYYRELEDIQRHYVEDVEEAARQNDAVAVARLMRQRARDRRDAKIERDRELEDAERDYEDELDELKEFLAERKKELAKDARDRLADLEENLAEQLEDANRARTRELEELDIYQDRRMQDIALQHKRELDDLEIQHADELAMLGTHLAEMEYLNESAVKELLRIHGDFIDDDTLLWENYYKTLRTIQTRGIYDPYGGGTPSPFAAPGEPGYYEEDPYARPYAPIQPPRQPQQPIAQPRIGGSPYDPPANIKEHCRLHPNDPVCAWYGLAAGGMFLATEPTPFMAGEVGRPEMVAAVPLSQTMNYNISLSGRIGVDGVSPGMEGDISAELMGLLKQFGEQLLAGAK